MCYTTRKSNSHSWYNHVPIHVLNIFHNFQERTTVQTYPLSPNPAQTNVGLELRELVLYITGDTLAVPFLTGDVIDKRLTP